MSDDGSPATGGTPLSLSEDERLILQQLCGAGNPRLNEEEIARASGLTDDHVRGGLQRLRSKGLVVVEERPETLRRLTPRGTEMLRRGLPEDRLLELLRAHPAIPADGLEALGLTPEEASAAIGILRRRGLIAGGSPLTLAAPSGARVTSGGDAEALRAISEGRTEVDRSASDSLVRRGLLKVEIRTHRHWSASEEGRILPLVETGSEPLVAVTGELLRTRGWEGRAFRPYDARARVPFLTGARENPYLAWLEEFEEILVGLGFTEAEGPILETEFWNNDVLFMPQDHPARSIHDALTVEGLHGRLPPETLLERVAAAHEGRPLPGEATPLGPGWGTTYDREIARRPVLRSQTTAVSARFLAARPTPPFRMYSLDRNLRREQVDPQHHVEFRQSEGIVGEEGMTLRHLVGLFRELSEAIGIRELKIRPSYFPFTEPSVEGYVRHPRLGWMEVFPGGLFRPEVLRPLGVEVPVLAWGIGVTRLALVALGTNDIRDLFADDLQQLRGGAA